MKAKTKNNKKTRVDTYFSKTTNTHPYYCLSINKRKIMMLYILFQAEVNIIKKLIIDNKTFNINQKRPS